MVKSRDKQAWVIWSLPEEFELACEVQRDELFEAGYFWLSKSELMLFGSVGKRFFLKNEELLQPKNACLIRRMADCLQIPLPLNFYGVHHRVQKKTFEHHLNKHCLPDLQWQMDSAGHEFWRTIAEVGEQFCLFERLTAQIIQWQIDVFCGKNVSGLEASKLGYYEDYFTMGLMLEAEADFRLYFSNKKFAECRICFEEVMSKCCDEDGTLFMDLLDNADFTESYALRSLFYNMSIAGSANIAKFFVYLIDLLQSEGVDIHDEWKNAECSINQFCGRWLARFLDMMPQMHNQVVAPFVNRVSSADIELGEGEVLPAGTDVYYYLHLDDGNVKSHIGDGIFPDADCSVKPFSKSLTFGSGLHRCSGVGLTSSWLHYLLKSFLEEEVNFDLGKGIQYTTHHARFPNVLMTSYVVSMK